MTDFDRAVELYNRGEYGEAVKWVKKAAAQGYAIAIETLKRLGENI